MTGRPDTYAMNSTRQFTWLFGAVIVCGVLGNIVARVLWAEVSTTKTVPTDMICILPEKEK